MNRREKAEEIAEETYTAFLGTTITYNTIKEIATVAAEKALELAEKRLLALQKENEELKAQCSPNPSLPELCLFENTKEPFPEGIDIKDVNFLAIQTDEDDGTEYTIKIRGYVNGGDNNATLGEISCICLYKSSLKSQAVYIDENYAEFCVASGSFVNYRNDEGETHFVLNKTTKVVGFYNEAV